MCDCKGPVRSALAKSTMSQVQSAYETALARSQRARAEGDRARADLFGKVASECEAELNDRVLSLAARSVLRESQEAVKQAKQMLTAVNR